MWRCLTLLLIAVAAVCPFGAEGYIDPPMFSSNSLTTHQQLKLSITSGVCDAFDLGIEPVVEVRPASIRIELATIHAYGDWCIYGASVENPYFLGPFPAGNYDVQVDRRYLSWNGRVVETLGTAPLVVTEASANAVPVMSANALTVCAMGLVLLGLVARRTRGR